MKRLTVMLTTAILLAGLVLLGLSDTVISLPDTSLSPNEVTSNVSQVSNSSATATIKITMYTLPND